VFALRWPGDGRGDPLGRDLEAVARDVAAGLERIPFELIQTGSALAGTTFGRLRDAKLDVVVWPAEYQTGNLLFPYTEAQQ
jgi:hypothetical protein